MAAKQVFVRYVYIVGNHDWLINRYPETRTKTARFLSTEDPSQYKKDTFPTGGFRDKCKIFGRHIDIYDPFNSNGDKDSFSLGDCIVIDLLNRFPEAMENEIGTAAEPVGKTHENGKHYSNKVFHEKHTFQMIFELGGDYHSIFDPDIQFVHTHAGVIYRFNI